MPIIGRVVFGAAARFLLLALFALSVTACSKCDVPVWRHDNAAPQSCHDEAPPQ